MEKIDRKGYWFIYMPDRIGCGKQGYFAEHRYVMEKHLGRSLRGLEQIHHINRNKKDNRIENLKLFASSSDHMKSEHYDIGNTTCLKKGHTPWNKGTKGLSKPNSGSFVKGRLSHNKNGVFVSCAECGEKIWTTPSTPRKFCSKECYLVSKKGFVTSVFL